MTSFKPTLENKMNADFILRKILNLQNNNKLNQISGPLNRLKNIIQFCTNVKDQMTTNGQGTAENLTADLNQINEITNGWGRGENWDLNGKLTSVIMGGDILPKYYI